jgi:hypothetical protein
MLLSAALIAQTLTSMTVSPDTKLVAAGFSDSLVRLYHLALLGKQRGKLGERAEKRAAGVLPQAAGKRARGGVRGCCCIGVTFSYPCILFRYWRYTGSVGACVLDRCMLGVRRC